MAHKIAKVRRRLTDDGVQALVDFSDTLQGQFFWDADVAGLRLRVGSRRLSWSFYGQVRNQGKRRTCSKNLGAWPAVSVADARKAAKLFAADVIRDRGAVAEPKPAITFAQALDGYDDDDTGAHRTGYLDHLRRQAEKRGKPDRWARNVERYAKTLLRPQWASWTLADMAASPAAVADWHRRITDTAGPVSANRCCQIIRALYKRTARLDLTLIKHNDPTAAVEFNSETPAQKGLAFKDFPKWKRALDKIESPIYRAYHLCELLTGTRPGELARLRWSHVKPRERSITISGAKAGQDITVPMSAAIARALKLARDADKVTGRRTVREDFVFPGAAQKGHRDALPARGNALRHTYRTVCADLGIDDLISHFLMGHAPAGISQGYIVRLLLSSGPAMRQAQRRVSQRIEFLLKLWRRSLPIAKPP